MSQKKKQTRSRPTIARPGFTLPEMILVVALTLFLLTVTVQGFVNSASQFSFANTAEKIEEMVRTARSLAISGKAQIDYIDFDKDTCVDKASSSPGCITQNSGTGGDDYVTPAHYGVNFASSGGTYTVTMFADNHSTTLGDEGKFNVGTGVTDYQAGKDIVLDKFVLPPGIQLIIPMPDGTTAPGNGTSATIFFLPVFADVSTDLNIPVSSPFFRFGSAQSQGTIIRKRCSQIHLLAGISEPLAATSVNLTNCP